MQSCTRGWSTSHVTLCTLMRAHLCTAQNTNTYSNKRPNKSGESKVDQLLASADPNFKVGSLAPISSRISCEKQLAESNHTTPS